MSTMTLDGVSEDLRRLGYNGYANVIDAHLREREEAKAGVTDALDYVPGELDKTAPDRIWLQIDTSASNNDREESWPGCDDVTWQDESVGGLEIQYVRADLVAPMLASAQQDFSSTYHGVLIRKMVEMLKNDEWADLFTGDEILGDLQVQIARLLASARVPDEIFAALRNVFYAGWNIDKFRVACHKDLDVLRDWMLAAAPKREEE